MDYLLNWAHRSEKPVSYETVQLRRLHLFFLFLKICIKAAKFQKCFLNLLIFCWSLHTACIKVHSSLLTENWFQIQKVNCDNFLKPNQFPYFSSTFFPIPSETYSHFRSSLWHDEGRHQNTSNHFHSKFSLQNETWIELLWLCCFYVETRRCWQKSHVSCLVQSLHDDRQQTRSARLKHFKTLNDFLLIFTVSDEESRHIPSTYDSGFVPFIPSQLETNPFQHHQHHHIDESHETDFYPPQVDHKYYSPYHTTFSPTVRPTGHRVFGRFHSPSTHQHADRFIKIKAFWALVTL